MTKRSEAPQHASEICKQTKPMPQAPYIIYDLTHINQCPAMTPSLLSDATLDKGWATAGMGGALHWTGPSFP